MLVLNNLKSRSEEFHGNNLTTNFFEGYYFKTVLPSKKESIIFIPGVFLPSADNSQKPHAFVMVFRNPDSFKCLYYQFSMDEFKAEKTDGFGFSIRIGKSTFTHNYFKVDLPVENLVPATSDAEAKFYETALKERKAVFGDKITSHFADYPTIKVSIKGRFDFSEIVRLPKSLYSPNIMGPFSYLPTLECYHGVVSLHHKTSGSIEFFNLDQTLHSKVFCDLGSGYVEKDYGLNFPKSWIWIQTNTFLQPESDGTTLMISVADVPLVSALGQKIVDASRIRGFLVIFYHGSTKKTYNLSLFTGAKVKNINFNLEEDNQQTYQVCNLSFKLGSWELDVTAKRLLGHGIPLYGPSFENGMSLLVEESLTVSTSVTLKVDGQVVFDDCGTESGMEVVGSMTGLIKSPEF